MSLYATGYDDKGRLTGERQTVENPETPGLLLWQHETTHAYNEQGLTNRVTPDSLHRGVADLRQRLSGGHEAWRHAAAGVHARPHAPGDGAQLWQHAQAVMPHIN
ncbi:hypothetical protein ACLBOM_19930 [Escherichia coli]